MLKALIAAVVCAPLLAGCIAVHVEGDVTDDLFAEEHEEHWEAEARDEHGMDELHERHRHALRLAVKAWMEADRHDLAERTEMALHAVELELEGRRDREAIEIIERSPGPEGQMELLRGAARLYAEWDMPDRRDMCADAADWLEHGDAERAHDGDRREHGEHLERRMGEIANALEREMAERRELEEGLRELMERMEGIEETLLELRNR